MIIIGLIGGVASGKSFVAQEFRRLGAEVLNGDAIGHEVLKLERVVQVLVRRWGKEILAADGSADRGAIARIVFAADRADQELQFLESVTHPEISEIIASRLEQLRQLGQCQVVVLDASVMLKAGWDSMCDRLIFVQSPRELRQARATERGLTTGQFRAREAAQLPVEEKRRRADVVIDNSGSQPKTVEQIEKVWQSLLQIA